MKQRKLFLAALVFGATIFAPTALASDSFADKCPDIPKCAAVVSELTGAKYVFDEDVKGKISSTTNTQLTKDNAELLFTAMLDTNGFTRLPLALANTFAIKRQRDAKDLLLPSTKAAANREPELPNNWDWYDMHYEVSNPANMDDMGRTCRNFMPPNTRIVQLTAGNRMIVTGPVPVLKRIYGLLREMDRPLTSAQLKKLEEERRMREQREKEKDKQGRTTSGTPALQDARCVPSFENGQPTGYRCTEISKASVYHKLGLKNGDLIVAINGQSLSDPEKAINAFSVLNNSKEAEVRVRRGNKTAKAEETVRFKAN